MTTVTVVDIETLGMAPPDALIELGCVTLDLDQPDQFHHYEELFGIPEGQIMSPDNRAVHHIDPLSLVGLPLFVPEGVRDLAGEDYLVAHNAAFERQWLANMRAPWICTYRVALRLVPDAPSHGNQCLKYVLGIEDAKDHHPPHRALPDAIVTSLVLLRLIAIAQGRNPDMPLVEILDRMVQITKEPPQLPRCPIGRQRGSLWSEIDTGFLTWMLRQPDMDPDLRHCADRELTRRRRS